MVVTHSVYLFLRRFIINVPVPSFFNLDSKDKTDEVAQSEVERGESSKRTYDDCTYQECPPLNISQASQIGNSNHLFRFINRLYLFF